MSAPTPHSAEAVAREVVDLIIRACYDPLSRRLMRDDAVALATAALAAHATAAVAAAERTAWKAGADEALRLARTFCQCGNAVKVEAPAAPPGAGEEMRAEYDLPGPGERGKYAERYRASTAGEEPTT